MNTHRALQDAFTELERRADAHSSNDGLDDYDQNDHDANDVDGAVTHDAVPETIDSAHRVHRVAPVAAAACVLAAASVLAWSPWKDSASSRPSASGPSASSSPHRPGTHGGAPVRYLPTPVSLGSAARLLWEPPQTGAELAAQAREILGDVASITVTPDGTDDNTPRRLVKVMASDTPGSVVTSVPTAPLPDDSASSDPDDGAGIYGTMIGATGARGGFDLVVFKSGANAVPSCTSDRGNKCVKSTRPGGHLAVGTWHDPNVPGGITFEVNWIRSSDGATVLLHFSTESDPKGMGTVTSANGPITLAQAVAFVTSTAW